MDLWLRCRLPIPLSWRDWIATQIEIERAARSSFVLFPIAMAIGICCVLVGGVRLSLTSLGFAAAAILLWAIVPVRSPVARLGAMIACGMMAGVCLSHVELLRTDTVILSGQATVRIDGRVRWREKDERGRYRYLIDDLSTDRPVLSRPPSSVRIVASSQHLPIPIGERYRGLVRLGPPSGPAYPGSYDFAFAPFFSGLGAYGYSLGKPELAASDDPPSFGERIARLRATIGERIRARLPGPEGAVAAALINGERAGIPSEIDDALRATGLYHILSISGFHMALVAGFTMIAVRTVIAAIPNAALHLPAKKIAAVVAIAVSTFYLLLSGDNVATERSYLMLLVMLGAVLIDRPALTLRTVSIAALVVLAVWPHAVLTATFHMSFAATAALVGAYGALMQSRWWNERLRARNQSWPRRIGLMLVAALLSSLLAGAATAPFAVYHFQRIAPFSLFANILATPIFSFWIMPLCLIAVLAMPFGIDGPFLTLIGIALTWVFDFATAFAKVLPDQTTGLMSASALLCFVAAILFASFAAGALRWIAVPAIAAGLFLSPVDKPVELLIFEDGRDVALVSSTGKLVSLRDRPSNFVMSQWERAFGGRDATNEAKPTDPAAPVPNKDGFVCADAVCRAVTASGIRVAWTDDYERTGELCDTSDVAIVARAIRIERCRSGASLVTLRTLRRTGSLALLTSPGNGEPHLRPAIEAAPDEWNIHRLAPWPEYWRKPVGEPGAGASEPAERSGKEVLQ